MTGRGDGFTGLRTGGGLSGYPNRAESAHDLVENSHASTALSYADGLAKAFEAAGDLDRPVVAVVGDGAMTGGMSWEALNNIGASGRLVVVVLNDNGCLYSPAVGGLAQHLARHLARLCGRRGYDALVGRVGMHGLPVTLVLDRAGVTGPDGASHHGMWDLAMLGIVPGMRVGAPCDAATLLEELDEAVEDGSGPTAECTVVDPRWVLPVIPALTALAESGSWTLVRSIGLPSECLPHGSGSEILTKHGLDGAGVVDVVRTSLRHEAPAQATLRLVPDRPRVLG